MLKHRENAQTIEILYYKEEKLNERYLHKKMSMSCGKTGDGSDQIIKDMIRRGGEKIRMEKIRKRPDKDGRRHDQKRQGYDRN